MWSRTTRSPAGRWLEIPVAAAVEIHDDGHDLTESQLPLAHAVALAVLEQPLLIERFKPLAKIVDIAEHGNELAHKDPLWFRLMVSQPATIRRSLWAGKPLSLIQNSG
jgi:hypothetical protein